MVKKHLRPIKKATVGGGWGDPGGFGSKQRSTKYLYTVVDGPGFK